MSKSLFRLLTSNEPNYSMAIDLWVYRNGSIGFHRDLLIDRSLCNTKRPIRLANLEEYLKAREKTIATNIFLPLPNEYLPALDSGDTILLYEGFFRLGQDIEPIPFTVEQQEKLLSYRQNQRVKELFERICLS